MPCVVSETLNGAFWKVSGGFHGSIKAFLEASGSSRSDSEEFQIWVLGAIVEFNEGLRGFQ